MENILENNEFLLRSASQRDVRIGKEIINNPSGFRLCSVFDNNMFCLNCYIRGKGALNLCKDCKEEEKNSRNNNIPFLISSISYEDFKDVLKLKFKVPDTYKEYLQLYTNENI